MKYALLTDNSVQWFSYAVQVSVTGEALDYIELDSGMSNPFLSNLFNRELSFSNMRLVIPGHSVCTWYGNWISEYEFFRIKKMIELYKSVKEYERLGRLE